MAYISLTSISEAVVILASGSYENKFCFKSFCFPTLYSVFGLLTKILTKPMLGGSRESFLECNTCREGNSFLISATMASQIKWVLNCKIAVDQWQRNLTICYFTKKNCTWFHKHFRFYIVVDGVNATQKRNSDVGGSGSLSAAASLPLQLRTGQEVWVRPNDIGEIFGSRNDTENTMYSWFSGYLISAD